MKRATKKTKEALEALRAKGWREVFKKVPDGFVVTWCPPGEPNESAVTYATARRRLLRVPCENFGMALDGPEPYRCGCVRKKGHRGQCRCKHGDVLPAFGR